MEANAAYRTGSPAAIGINTTAVISAVVDSPTTAAGTTRAGRRPQAVRDGPQPDHRRQTRHLGVGHHLRDQVGGDGEAGQEVATQPATPVVSELAEAGKHRGQPGSADACHRRSPVYAGHLSVCDRPARVGCYRADGRDSAPSHPTRRSSPRPSKSPPTSNRTDRKPSRGRANGIVGASSRVGEFERSSVRLSAVVLVAVNQQHGRGDRGHRGAQGARSRQRPQRDRAALTNARPVPATSVGRSRQPGGR